MKHILRKLHKSHDPNRTNNETLPNPSSSSSSQSQPSTSSSSSATTASSSMATQSISVSFDHGGSAAVGDLVENQYHLRQGHYSSSQEDFEMQLALAISASNSDIRNHSENDQIRAATLLSLGESYCIDNGRDKEVSGEVLARRFWLFEALESLQHLVVLHMWTSKANYSFISENSVSRICALHLLNYVKFWSRCSTSLSLHMWTSKANLFIHLRKFSELNLCPSFAQLCEALKSLPHLVAPSHVDEQTSLMPMEISVIHVP